MKRKRKMNDFSTLWKIGSISFIDQQKIKFKTVSSDISDRIFNGSERHINSLNQYLYSFLNVSTKVIFKVISIEDSEKEYNSDINSKFSDKYTFTAFPVGEIRDGKFKPGVIDIPMVGSNVYACDYNDLSNIFCQKSNSTSIGNLSGYNSIRPTVSLDSIFSGHVCILGNTGSGKSTTSRLLIDSIYNKIELIKKDAKFVVFDLHDDYKGIHSEDENYHYFNSNSYYLPVGKLSIEDWSSILSPSERVQKPLLERTIKYSTLNEDGKNILYACFAYNAIDNTNLDSHSSKKFQIMKYLSQIKSELQVEEKRIKITQNESALIKNIDQLMENFNLDYGNLSDDVVNMLRKTLKSYIGDSFINGNNPDIDKLLNKECLKKEKDLITIYDIERSMEFVFAEEEVLGNKQARSYSEGLVTQVRNLKDKYCANLFQKKNRKSIIDLIKNNDGICIIDVSDIIDDDGLKLFSNFITRMLFNRNRTSINVSPTYLIYDEAHRYISENNITEDSIFNRIAREGRKFGVNLCTISQIPSELSRVVLSQTGTFIIHRIQNYIDLEYIRKNVPAISNNQVNRLPYFAPGNALILGSSINVPTELTIDGKFKDSTPNISMFEGK